MEITFPLIKKINFNEAVNVIHKSKYFQSYETEKDRRLN